MNAKKMIALLLMVSTLLTMLIACNGGGQGGETTTPGSDASDLGTTAAAVTLPSEATSDQTVGDLQEAVIKILAWQDAEMLEFEYEESATDQTSINDAILQRNDAVEKRLNCKLEFVYTPGNNSKQQDYLKKAESFANGDESDFIDMYASYSMTTALLSTKGLTHNLIPLQKENGLNFEHPWWPATMVAEAMFDNSLYVCTGDISTNLLWMMETMYFNKDLMKELQHDPDELYKLVKDGKWTLEKLYEYSKDVYVDTDTNGSKSAGDTYGYVVAWQGYFDDFYVGAGFKICERDSDGKINISEEWGGEAEDSFATAFMDFTKTDDFWYANSNAYSGPGVEAFSTGRALFTNNRSRQAKTFRETSECEYGILPMPKLNELQENYSTNLGFPYTLYAISNTSPSPENTALVLESMAAQSYTAVTPALFYDALQLRYSPEVDDANTFDILRETVCFDIGRIYCTPLNNYCYSIFRNACKSGSYSYANNVKNVKKAAGILLTTLINDLKKNELE
ncbi:MAG: hypothetical protein IIX97_01020 [Clostridia bacterium]|nr:hypothetical protein [Clostridia bacterium]